MRTPDTGLVINSTTTAAVRLCASVKRFTSVTFAGVKALDSASGAPTANAGTVYFGLKANECPFQLKAGFDTTVTAPPGQFFDLSQFWFIPATAGDGIYYAATLAN